MSTNAPATLAEIQQTTVEKFEPCDFYEVLTGHTTEELAEKVSQKLQGGSYQLVGGPVVFNGCLCQAVALLGIGIPQ